MNKKESKQMIKASMKTYIPEKEVVHYEIDGQDYTVEIKKRLNLVECDLFIRLSLALLFGNEEGVTDSYHPERFDVAIFAATLRFYTDIDVTPYNLSDIETLYNSVKFRNFILTNSVKMDKQQRLDLESAVKEKVQLLLKEKRKNSIDILADKLSGYIDAMSHSFDNVSSEDVAGFMKGLSKLENVDENALVEAVKNHLEDDSEENISEPSEDEIDAYI